MERHHWIPQFYLKLWSDPSAPVGQRGRIWVYDKNAKKWNTDFAKNLAQVPEFYALEKKDGTRTNILEKEYLQKVENNIASIIKNKLLKNKNLDNKEKFEVALFISLFIFRSPNFINKIKSLTNNILNDWIKPEIINGKSRSFSNKELRQLREKYQKEAGREISIEEMRKQINKMETSDFKLEVTQNRLLLSTFNEKISGFARFFHSFNWQFLRCNNCEFISGDLIYASPFPLSPDLCIAMNNYMDDNIFVDLDKYQIKKINELIFENSENFIISISKNNLCN